MKQATVDGAGQTIKYAILDEGLRQGHEFPERSKYFWCHVETMLECRCVIVFVALVARHTTVIALVATTTNLHVVSEIFVLLGRHVYAYIFS